MILYGIAVKPVKKGPMEPRDHGLVTSAGLEGNYYGSPRNLVRPDRQITVISLTQWQEAMKELGGSPLPWYMRRANLCVTGYSFGRNDVGKALSILGMVYLEITGETVPCKRMNEILPGLQGALAPSWRGGVTCRVVAGGKIRIGDSITI